MIQNNFNDVPAEEKTSEKRSEFQFYKYAALNFVFYITISLGGYVTIFLQSIGFDAQQVGIITALNSGVGAFSSPIWGMLGDKIRSVRKVINIILVISTVLFAFIPMSKGINIGGISFLFILIPITMFFKMPIMSLVDNWVLENSVHERLNYGALRAFGALSFAIASLALGYILPITGVEFTFYASAVVTIPALLMIIYFKTARDDVASKGHLTLKEMQISKLFKNYYLIAYIIFTAFQRISFHCSMIFLPFLVTAVDGNIAQMGIVMAIRAFMEIPMMLLLKPLRRRLPLYHIIFISSGFFIIECIMYSFANSFAMVAAISVLHGIGNGLMLPTSISYVFSLAPDNLKATSQTLLGSTNSIAGVLGGILGGVLITIFGVKQFYLVIGLMMLVTLALYLLSFVFGEKVLGKSRPGLSID
ncbi:MAG TPA: MFS transporter [Clostridia bacterium]|nr:MFS transporter [Clostridia bacterium]